MGFHRRTVLFACAIAVAVGGATLAEARGRVIRKPLAVDASFGVRGVSEFRSLGTERLDRFSTIATNASGAAYVAGTLPAPAIVKLDDRGAPDPSFGKGGVAVLPLNGLLTGMDVSAGIVVCGRFDVPQQEGDPEATVAVRVLADGSGLDPSFGDGGRLRLDASFEMPFVGLGGVRIDRRDWSYVAMAGIHEGDADTGGLVRFSADGVFGTAFGDSGVAGLGDDEPASMVRDFVVDSAGRTIVALGESIVRFDAAGRREAAFGGVGVLVDDRGDVIVAHQLAVADGDRIVALGTTSRTRGLCLYRWTSEGFGDLLFGRYGRIDLPRRHRGAPLNTRSFALVPDMGFGPPPGDGIVVTGTTRLRRGRPSHTYDGWFAESIDVGRPGVARLHVQRADRPEPEHRIYFGGVVATPWHAYAIGHTTVRVPQSKDIELPFVASFLTAE